MMLPRLIPTILLAIAGLFLAGTVPAQTPVAASGRDFYLALPSVDFASGGHALRINVTATNSATVTLSFLEYGTTETVTLGTGQRWERVIPVDSIMLLEQEYRANRTLRITSTEPVTVNAVDDAVALCDGYLVLPTESLGFEYLAMAYPGVPVLPFPNLRGGLVAVIATEDATEVRIVPSVQTKGGNDAGVQYSVTLNRGEIYQVLPLRPAGTDLSGTRITASKPVSVISGHRGVPTDSISAYNTLLEQMVPVADWGRKFYTVRLAEQSRGRYRVLARSAGTEVFVNGLRIVTLGAGGVHEFLTDQASVIEASQPVMLAQIGTHRGSRIDPPEIDSDPSMAIVNPVDSYAARFEWSTPTLAPRGISPEKTVPWRHWAMITAPTGARASVRLDGAPVVFTVPHGDGAYWTTLVEVQPGPHRVTATEPVNVQLFGDSQFDAYAFPAGMRLREPFRAAPLTARTCASTLDTVITLANFGAQQIEVTGVAFSGGTTRRFPDIPFLVPAGGTRQLGIRVALPGYGRLLDTAILTTTTSGSRPLMIPIEVWRDSLALEALEQTVDFGSVGASTPTRDSAVRLVNRGTGPVAVTAATFVGPFSVVSPTLPTTVGAGDTLALRIRFAPTAPGIANGSMTASLGPCGAPVRVVLTGQRLRGAGIAVSHVTVPEVGCGAGGFVEVPIIVRSVGEEPLRFDSLEIRGPGAAAFTVSSPPAGTMIAPRDSLVAVLRFAPSATGVYSIQLRVWNAVSPGGYLLTDPIEARSVGIEPVLSSTALDFGAIDACGGEKLARVTITNRGTTSMRLDTLRTSTPSFVVETAEGLELAPGASAEIALRFQPRAGGVSTDTLRIGVSPCDTMLFVALTGSWPRAELSRSVDSLFLGLVVACRFPADGLVLFRNQGAVPLELSDVSVNGAGFVVWVGDTTLAPGEATVVSVGFEGPPGSHEGTLTVRAEPCGILHEIPIRVTVATLELALEGSLDFGALEPDVAATRTITLRNTGTAVFRVDTFMLSPHVTGLEIISPAPPFWLAAGADTDVVIRYLSNAPAAFATILTTRIGSPCDSVAATEVRGAYNAARTLSLALPDTTGWVDSRILIPLAVSRAVESDERATVRAEIRWDRTLLALEEVSTPAAGATVVIIEERRDGDEQVLVLEFDGIVPEAGVLAGLAMRVLVGAAERTPLRIAEATARSEGVDAWSVTRDDGSFATLGICSIGGSRFVRIAGTFVVRGVSPNPAGERLRLALEGDASARVTVALVDGRGSIISTPFDGELPGGRHEIVVTVADVPDGVYQLEVRSGGGADRVSIVIVR